MRLRAGSATDVGNVRSMNQDDLLITDGAIFAVADGMGGHASGEVASAEAVAALRHAYEESGSVDDVRRAVELANEAVYRRGSSEPQHAGMGTTLTLAAVVDGGRLAIANVGDSRTYLLRDGELVQLTLDHSFVQEAVRHGQLSPEEAEHHPRRNQLTRALGVQDDVQVDVDLLDPLTGDRLLLCSDGLWDELGDQAMASILKRLADPDAAAAELVRLAKEAGGRDNITVVVVDVVEASTADRGLAASAALAAEGEEATAEAKPGDTRPGAPADAVVDQRPRPVIVEPVHTPPPHPPEAVAAALKDKPRLLTWRVGAFGAALVVVVAVAAVVLARGGKAYAVGVDGSDVVIRKGQVVVERTPLKVEQVPVGYQSQLLRGHPADDLATAHAYVDGLARAAVAAGTLQPGGGAGVVVSSTSSVATASTASPAPGESTAPATAATTPSSAIGP
jgi:protein phosphatase